MSGIVVLPEFFRGYIECALWSSTDDNDMYLSRLYSPEDLTGPSREGALAECAKFLQENLQHLEQYTLRCTRPEEGREWACAGHDFWLTRNGHGAGFWDRGLGRLGDAISESARKYKEQDLYVGDDGKLYIMGFENYVEKEKL